MSAPRFLGTDPAREAAFMEGIARLKAEGKAARRARDAEYWRRDWADAKTGPLPMAIFIVRSWRRLTHKWHPSYLALSALAAANEAIVLRLPDPDDYPSLSTAQKLRLRLLLWLTGSTETEGEASARGDLAWGPAPICEQVALGEALANQLLHPIGQGSQPARRAGPQSAGPCAEDPRRSSTSEAASRSPAISTDSRAIPSQPPAACDGSEPATRPAAAHRLSEVSE